MGYIILILVGALLGWVGVIVLRREARGGTLPVILASIAGALAGGLLFARVPLDSSLSPRELLWGAIGAGLAILVTHLAQSSRDDNVLG